MDEIKKFKILSIDGGGLRGLIPLQVIKKIESLTDRPIHKSFDMIAGTSTGGIIACALTVASDVALEYDTRKYSLDEIEDIYKTRGEYIFPQKNNFIGFLNSVKSLIRPQFSVNNLDFVLKKYFSDKRITSCLRPIFITSYDFHRNKPIFFTTREATSFHEKNAKLVEICRATSAAPTYFEPYNFNYDTENVICVDGGVIMNSPSIGALTEILGNPEYKFYKLEGKRLKLEDICILSLGTGIVNTRIKNFNSKKWGSLQWIKPIVDISIRGPVKIAHHQLETVFAASGLVNNYFRIDINIDEEHSEMSDSRAETINYILNEAASEIKNNDTLDYKLKQFLRESGIKIIEKEE